MSLFGLRVRKKTNRKRARRPVHRARLGSHCGLFHEALECRNLLSVTLSPIDGPDTSGVFDVPSGKDLYVPLTASDPGQTVSFTASSSNPDVQVTVLTGNPTLQLTVEGTNSSGQAFSGTLTIQLFENLAPDTVAAIEALVNSGFYDGLTFYRIVPDFVIQGGANGTKSAATFDDEFNVALSFNSPGLLAMANPGTVDSNTSEFFITDISQPLGSTPQYLNFRHSIFGQLTSGFDTYNQIMDAQGITSSNSTPTSPVTITSATIITDTQNGVVQISEPNNFTGTATITITASSTDGTSDQQSFTVSAAPPSGTTSSQPLVLAPITDATTTVNTNVSFQISADDFYGDSVTFSVTGVDSFTGAPVNVTVQVSQTSSNTALVTLIPESFFTGTIQLVATRRRCDRQCARCSAVQPDRDVDGGHRFGDRPDQFVKCRQRDRQWHGRRGRHDLGRR